MAVSADIGITYHLSAQSIPVIFQRYRRGMDEITHVFIRNYIRDAVNKSASKTKIGRLYFVVKFNGKHLILIGLRIDFKVLI